MQYPIQITLRGIGHSEALERYIVAEARKLDRICDCILTGHVLAEALPRRRQDGVQYVVRLSVTLPGTEVVVNRDHGEDVQIALRDAFGAAGLQLQNHMRRLRGSRHHAARGASGPRS